jgi:hypothetical protein
MSSPMMAIASLGIALLASGIYAVTRPCVIGSCDLLQVARSLNQESMRLLHGTTSAIAIVDAYDKVLEANYHLSMIPFWSGHHDEAQILLREFEADAQILGYIVAAQKQAYQAAEMSQNPPLPLETWIEIRRSWRQAIAHLKKVPAGAIAYPFAQTKRAEYETNLRAINQRIALEEAALKTISAARHAAQIAEARENKASALRDWHLVRVTWQVVINRLQEVPRGTMAYAEAQQLQAIYQPRLATAITRHQQESVSETAYHQAVNLAERAMGFEQQNQWSSAVAAWQDALSQAQRVLRETTYHHQAEPLLNSYSRALTSAQQNLRLSIAIQRAEVDLERICSTTPPICNYTLKPESIEVQISAEFDRVVEQAIITSETATYSGDPQDSTFKVNTLLDELAAISEETQVAIELLNANGIAFGTYTPDQPGYNPATVDAPAASADNQQ